MQMPAADLAFTGFDDDSVDVLLQQLFDLFVKSPVEDEKAFCAAAKKYNILIVPGSSFGCPGYVRIAYCVAYETIVNSLPKFKELAGEYK